MTDQQWQQKEWSTERGRELAQTLKIPLEIAALLLQRGLTSPEEASRFLRPALADLPSPFLMQGMDMACELILTALHDRRPIVIYGDYDADGLTASAVLASFFRELGTTAHCYQPDRLTDGYGLHKHLLDRINDEIGSAGGHKLLITVDCGICNQEEVAHAQKLGFTVIVTDHHQPPATPPAAEAVLNPWLPGCAFPFKELAGVGVAFFLVMGLRSRLHEAGFWQKVGRAPNLKQYLDLVAIGTITDMMPLLATNRVLVKAGLEVLQSTKREGLKALLAANELTDRKLQAEDIAFKIGPCINAPGRLDHPGRALELLMTEEPSEAGRLARQITEDNNARKLVCEKMFEQAKEKARQKLLAGDRVIIVEEEDWPVGLIGIVATKLSKNTHRPTVVLSRKNGVYKGSGRSIPGLDLFSCTLPCRKFLIGHGGHPNAIGITVSPDELESFKKALQLEVLARTTEEMLRPRLDIDYHFGNELPGGVDFFLAYSLLAPFGTGNPEPLFAFDVGLMRDMKLVGTNHLKFSLKSNKGKGFDGIGFNLGDFATRLYNGESGVVAVNFRHHNYRGKEGWQAVARDFQLPQT